MIYARLFRPTKSALRDFSHDVPTTCLARTKSPYPLPRSSRDASKLPSIRASVSFFFFLFFLFLFTPQTLPRLLYSSFTISIERERKYRRILLVKVKGRRGISVGNSSTSITSENYIGSHAWTSLKSEGRKRLRLFLRESPCDASRRETSHPYHN